MRLSSPWRGLRFCWNSLLEASDLGFVRLFRRRVKKLRFLLFSQRPFRFGLRPRKRSYIPWGEGLEQRQLMAVLSGITEYSITTASSGVTNLTTGPDGKVWFTENSVNKVAKISQTGTVTEYSLPGGSSGPKDIVAGPDGNLWATFNGSSEIAKITTSGSMTTYTGSGSVSQPVGIAVGSDGNLWFAESSDAVGKITTGGTVTTYSAGFMTSPYDIVPGSDGALWFTDSQTMPPLNYNVSRIATDGTITNYALPSGVVPQAIAASNNLIWVSTTGGSILKMDLNGNLVATYTANTSGGQMATGPDGNIWFDGNDNKVYRITPDGTITGYDPPTASSGPAGITAGPDNGIWFGEQSANKIAKLSGVNSAVIPVDDPAQISGAPFNVSWQTGQPELTIPLDGSRSTPGLPDAVGMSGVVPLAAATFDQLALKFNGSTVNVLPIIEDVYYSDPNGAVPNQLDARLKWNNGSFSGWTTFSTSGHSAGDAYLISLQVGSAVTSSGLYPWTIEVKATFGADTLTRDMSGNTYVTVLDSTASNVGVGWSIAGLDKLVSVTGGIEWVYGSGGARFFTSISGTSNYTSPSNDFGSLVKNGDNSFTYNAKDQVKWEFDSSGKLTKIHDAIGFAVTYTYDGGGKISTIKSPDARTITFTYDGSSRLNGVTLPSSRTITITQDGTSHDLTVAQTADGARHSFTYDGSHRVTNLQLGSTSTTLAYASNSTVGTITLDATTNETLSPRIAQGLATSPAVNSDRRVGALTDPLSHTTTVTYDALGRTTTIQTADGARTTMVRDIFGQVTQQIDPLGRTITYTYSYGSDKGDLTKITRPDGTTEQFQYDSTFHKQTADIDQYGNRATISYDGSGRPTGTIGNIGGGMKGSGSSDRTTLTYYTIGTGANLLKSQTDIYGNLTTYAYDSSNRLTSVIDKLSNRTTFTYDSAANVQTITDVHSKVTTFAYDGMRRVTAVTNQLNLTTTTSYNALGHVSSVIDPLSNRTTYQFDTQGRQTSMQDVLSNYTTTVYDAAGNVSAIVDPLGERTSFTYDSVNRRTSVQDPLGNLTTTVYDSSGAVIGTIDALGNRSTVNYDSAGRVSTQVDALNNTTTTTYDTNGQISTIVNALGKTVTYVYDSYGRYQATIDQLGNRTTTTFDSKGRPETTINALNKTSTTVYDTYGRVQATVDPLGKYSTVVYDNFGNVQATIDPLGNITTTSFDTYGRPEATLDPLGHRVTTVYDAKGRVSATIDQLNNRTTIVYDAYGRQQNLIDADNNKATFVYDALNRVVQEIDPLVKTTTTTYDAVGRVSTQIDRLGREIDFSYDAAGRLKGQVWYSAPIVVEDNRLTFTFDAAGNELTAQDSHGTYTMTYDAVHEVTGVQDVWGKRLTFTWDAVGNRTQVQDSAGGTTDSRFDALGNLTYRSYTESATVKLSVTQVYDADSRTSEQYRYGTSFSLVSRTSLAYDAASNLTNLQHRDGSSNNIANYTYVYDAASRLSTETRNGTTVTYTYDNSNEVTADGTVTVTYDANGNRNNGSYTTGIGNQLTGDGTWTYTYDNEGNLTKKSKGANAETWTYGYDEKNELIWVKHSATDGGAIDKEVDFKYDVFGNRIEKDYDDDGAGPHSATVTRFAYDGWKNTNQHLVGNENWDVWADLDGSSSLTTRYIRGDVIDQLFARIDSGTTYWELTDRLGSVRDVIDNSAVVKDTIDYNAFGNITSETNSSFRGRYAWTGREIDTEISLQYNRARYYDAATGRWISRDPMGFDAGDSNLYRYARNEPIALNDASGLVPWDLFTDVISGGTIAQIPAPNNPYPRGKSPTWLPPSNYPRYNPGPGETPNPFNPPPNSLYPRGISPTKIPPWFYPRYNPGPDEVPNPFNPPPNQLYPRENSPTKIPPWFYPRSG